MADPFEDIGWKIRRAYQHFEALNDMARSFLTNFYRFEAQIDGQHRVKLVITHVEPMPPEMSLLIGDVAHNLRSARPPDLAVRQAHENRTGDSGPISYRGQEKKIFPG
jgi:hypothetical protein